MSGLDWAIGLPVLLTFCILVWMSERSKAAKKGADVLAKVLAVALVVNLVIIALVFIRGGCHSLGW